MQLWLEYAGIGQTLQAITATVTPSTIGNHLSNTRSGTFLAVAELYLTSLQQKKGKNAPTQSTIENYRSKLSIYGQLLSNIEFKEITRTDIAELIDLSYNIPANITKIRYNKCHSNIVSLIRDKDHQYKRLEVTSVSKYTSELRKVCEYAFKNNYCNENPAGQADFHYTKTPQVERLPVSTDDLTKIFNGHVYKHERLRGVQHKAFHFWLPLLGAFTGARINELCSLRVADVKHDADTNQWYIDINDQEASKRLKTVSSRRIVPLTHPIIDAGFLRYLAEQKQRGRDALFSDGLTFSEKSGRGDKASKWFNKLEKRNTGKYTMGYLARCRVKKPGDSSHKVFHSFRHTFIHNLKNNPAIQDITRVADLVGHEKGLQTSDYGGKQYELPIKIDTILKLDYGIDLSHVSWDTFRKKL